jgi:hypothetical protein
MRVGCSCRRGTRIGRADSFGGAADTGVLMKGSSESSEDDRDCGKNHCGPLSGWAAGEQPRASELSARDGGSAPVVSGCAPGLSHSKPLRYTGVVQLLVSSTRMVHLAESEMTTATSRLHDARECAFIICVASWLRRATDRSAPSRRAAPSRSLCPRLRRGDRCRRDS